MCDAQQDSPLNPPLLHSVFLNQLARDQCVIKSKYIYVSVVYIFRLSIIESGPVSTSFPSRMLDIDSADDGFEGVDEETKQLLSNVIEKQKSALPNISQSPDEIARFIMDVLHEDNPHLRYQTSKTLATAVADKLHDSTGDKPADIMYQRFFS